MATEQEKDGEMSTKKDKRKLRVVNPKEDAPAQPLLDRATKKQLIISLITTVTVVGGVKLIEWAYGQYTKDKKPESPQKGAAPNPMLPGATTPAMFQSPYNQMMRPLPPPMQPQMQALPGQGQQVNPMTVAAPEAPPADEAPKWFAEYAEMMDTRMAKLEKKRSKPLRKKVEDYDEE